MSATLRAEFLKLRTVKTAAGLAGLAVAVTALIATLEAATAGTGKGMAIPSLATPAAPLAGGAAGRYDPVDEAPRSRGLREVHSAGEHHFRGPGCPSTGGDTLYSARVGDTARLCFDLTDPGALGGPHKVAREARLECAGSCRTAPALVLRSLPPHRASPSRLARPQ